MPLRFYLCRTALGWIALVLSYKGLRATTLPQPDRRTAQEQALKLGASAPATPREVGDLPGRLRQYALGRAISFQDVKIDWEGLSPFRRAVLQAAMSIPPGQTRSYRWVAEQVGNRRAAQAVGRVMATNPLPIIVPCHRVVSSDGSLGGYGGGLAMKAALLRLERGEAAGASPACATRSNRWSLAPCVGLPRCPSWRS